MIGDGYRVHRLTTRTGMLAVLCASLLAGCGESAPPPAAAPAPTAPSVPAPNPAAPTPQTVAGAIAQQTTALTKAADQVLAPAPPRYSVRGRRDPFENLELTSKERENGPAASVVSNSKLTGIVRGGGATLALVETAQGMGYILKRGDTLGDGRLVEIGADEVIFSVPTKPGSAGNRVVLKIVKD